MAAMIRSCCSSGCRSWWSWGLPDGTPVKPKDRLIYITTKTRRFRIRLAGFMNMIKLSLETKLPRLSRKLGVFAVLLTSRYLSVVCSVNRLAEQRVKKSVPLLPSSKWPPTVNGLIRKGKKWGWGCSSKPNWQIERRDRHLMDRLRRHPCLALAFSQLFWM